MSNGYLVSLVSLLVGAGLALGQSQQPPPPPPAAPPAAIGAPVPAPSSAGTLLFSEPGHEGAACPKPSILEYGLDTWGQFHFGAEYVLWFFPNDRQPSRLASTDSLNNFRAITLATLGEEKLDRGTLSGARFSAGYWLHEANPWVPGKSIPVLGVEGRFFTVGKHSVEFRNETEPLLVRPFFDLNNRRESGVVLGFPGLNTANIGATAEMSIWGAEANVWRNLYIDPAATAYSVDAMIGFRYANIDQDIRIDTTTVYNRDLSSFPEFAAFAGNRITGVDSIATHNNFYAVQVGVGSKFFLESVLIESEAKLAVGTNHEEVNIFGSQLRTLANGTSTLSAGNLLALPSNIGRHSKDKFNYLPEFGVKMSVPLGSQVTLSAGFTAMYWNHFARAGLQIDRVIDITQIPNFPAAAGATPTGLNRPTVPFAQDSLWMLGMTLGVEFKW